MNLNYKRSRAKEYYVFHLLEKEKKLTFRTSGSHGIADVIALSYSKDCPYPNHFVGQLVQVKVSEGRAKGGIETKAVDTPIGGVNLEVWKFPVKSKKWQKKYSKKAKKLKKKTNAIRRAAIKGGKKGSLPSKRKYD